MPKTSSPARRTPHFPCFAPDTYLTDGVRLLRVMAQRGPFTSIEDCRTLEVTSYTRNELEMLDLREVGPALQAL